MRKVLLLGGTGAIGKALINQLLLDDQIELFVTSRQSLQPSSRLTYLKGNAHDTDFLHVVLAEHYDAIIDFMYYCHVEEFERRISMLLASTRQYVFISSSRVYANSDSPITEQSVRLLDSVSDGAYLSSGDYALTKAREEDVLLKQDLKNWTIVRPYITFGENRFQLGCMEKEGWLYRALQGRSVVFSHDINNKYTAMTSGDEVASAIATLLNKSEAMGQIYQIASGKSIRWSDVLAVYLQVIEKIKGFRPKVVYAEKDLYLSIPHTKWQVYYDRIYDRYFSSDKIETLLGYPLGQNMKEELIEALGRFVHCPSFKPIDWGLEGLRDKEAKEHTPLSEIPNYKFRVVYLIYRYLPLWFARSIFNH